MVGLGDTNYSNFGAHPSKIEKKMIEMGAQSFYRKVIADEVEGCVVVVSLCYLLFLV